MVRAAIAELDEDLREIIVLRDIEGLTYDELSDVLRLESGTVKSRLHRARQALRRGLQPYYGQSEAAGAAPAG
jgi:RNA polymerase sigma-70 factor (ECF subfamily)